MKETTMTVRHPVLLLVAISLLAAAPARAALDKEAKKWLEGVAPLILPDEQKLYEGLKDKNDQLEFQKIFWARRDLDLGTPENEFQAQYEAARAEADQRFKVVGKPGSVTDCGRVFILLGEPAEVKKDSGLVGEVGLGGRNPETWRYRGERFSGGEAVMSFNPACMAPDSFRKQLDRVAADKVVHPNIDYRLEKDGHLVKLADLLPKPSPAQTLLRTPRQDFQITAQQAYLKAQGSGTALLGLVRGDSAGLPVDAAKHLRVVVCAQAEDADGKVAAFTDQEADAEVGADGAFLASFRMGLKPGKYTLKAGALEPKTGKGSLAEMPIEVPDFNGGALASTMFLLDNVEEKASPDPADAFAAFTLGRARFVPHVGHTYSKAQPLWFFYQYYDAQADEKTGKAAVTASASIFRGTAPLAKSPDQTFDSVVGGTTIGPIDLSTYFPGKFKVQVKISDAVAKKELTQELLFDLTK
jgi:GWxTD domain-containing protein